VNDASLTLTSESQAAASLQVAQTRDGSHDTVASDEEDEEDIHPSNYYM
jgi:hypothetical protein